MDNLTKLPTEKNTVVNTGGKPVQTLAECGQNRGEKRKNQKSYPQVIHFLWITVEKDIHKNHNGIHNETDGGKNTVKTKRQRI